MDGQKSPEYRAITHDRHKLEGQLANYLVPIAEVLRDQELLTDYQCDAICGAGKDGPKQLITAVLQTIELRPVSTFFKVVQVMKDKGTPALCSYIEATIEGKRKEIYRQELAKLGSVESQEWDVFISYYHETKTNAAVDEIAKSLEAKKLKVFVVRSAPKPGAIWSAEMVGAIHKCRAFIAVLTKKYARSPLCHGELYEAEFHGKTTYAVKLEQDWESESGAKPVVDIVLKTQYTTWNEENLKKLVDTITAKLENQDKVLESFKREIENRATLNQTVMQVILHGNAGVGKTSLIKVLAGDRVNEHEPSTPVMEEPKQIEISTIVVKGSKSILNWKYLKTLKEEAGFIVGQANYTRSVDTSATKPNSKSGGLTSQKQEERSFESRYQQDEESQSQDIKLSETVTDSEAVQKAREVMEKLEGEPWTLYISDVGGQLEFQELIPALTSGPSLHFIVLSAKFKLTEHFPVVYRKTHKRDQDTKPYESHCSVKEGILQQISTILSTGLNGHEPKIIFILTFYEGNLDKLKEIDKELKELIGPIKLDAFEPAEEELLCHPIDNINPAEEDVRRIQETVERIGECYKVGTGNYYTVQTPYSWLHFGIALREKKSPVLSYEQCLEIGQQCGIPNKEGINEALEFLHSNIGTVRFFNNDQTLRDIVITKPSILFENITRLLEDTFTFKGGPRQHTEFQTKGIFQIEHALSRIKTNSELFTKEKFLAFLEHQYILARIKEDKFFMPCSLVHAAPVKNHLQEQVQTYPALLIAFCTTTHYVPRGVFGFMIAELLSHTPEDSYPTILRENKIFQNQATFTFGPYQDEFRLSSFPSYIKIDVYESAPTKDREVEFLLFKICCNFRQRVEASLKIVLNKFNYTKNADPVLAFFCTKCDRPHPAHMYDSTRLSITCNVKGWVQFPLNYQVWFGKPESNSKTFLPDIDQVDRKLLSGDQWEKSKENEEMTSQQAISTEDIPAETFQQATPADGSKPADRLSSTLSEEGMIAQVSVEITNKEQHFKWNLYGLFLFVPMNSLPAGVEKCVLNIEVYTSLPCVVSELVSAVYKISTESDVEFKQEITLKIQYSCTKSEALSFCRVTDSDLSNFSLISGGIFDGETRYGSIKTKKFSYLMILLRKVISVSYYAFLFYKKYSAIEVDIRIVFCKRLNASISAIEKHFHSKRYLHFTTVLVKIFNNVELVIEDSSTIPEPQKWWNISSKSEPMNLEKIRIEEWFDGSSISIPQFELTATYRPPDGEQVCKLSRKLSLKNKKEFNFFLEQEDLEDVSAGDNESQQVAKVNFFTARDYWLLRKKEFTKFNGDGITVAILDTDVDESHIAIKKNTKRDISSNVDDTKRDHGTAVAGVVAGAHLGKPEYEIAHRSSEKHKSLESIDTLRIGVAPEASLLTFNVCEYKVSEDKKDSGFHYSEEKVLAALERIEEHNKNSCVKKKIRIIVMSFQLRKRNDKITEQLNKLSDTNVVCVVASGNFGNNRDDVGYPASHKKLIVVGSCTEFGRCAAHTSTPCDIIKEYLETQLKSSADSPQQYTEKEDKHFFLALGESVLIPKVTLEGKHYLEISDGTSYAAPAVAGLIALLMQLQDKEKCILESIKEKMGTAEEYREGKIALDIKEKCTLRSIKKDLEEMVSNKISPGRLLQQDKVSTFFWKKLKEEDKKLEDYYKVQCSA